MSFQIGDRIAHPLHGAGVIDRIESRRIGRESREYFVLKLQGSGMVVMVPKNACDEVGVRPIVDADTGRLLAAREGAILHASIVGVTKGQSGKAGELKGNFLKAGEQIGSLMENCEYGIYGVLDDMPENLLYPQGLRAGARSAVHTGTASIIATVDADGPQEYGVEIVRCFAQSEPSQKGMILRVTDERLLEKTGGIVQGMSGSPILQDGRIIGAVTHVYLSDATQGYGMYIEWMLEKSDAMDASEQAV